MHQWTPDLSVGVEAIDAQHREIFAAANAFLEASRGDNDSTEEIERLMAFLEDYVVNHFNMEEIYMRRHTYPGYVEHKAAHTGFINDFYDLRQELDENGASREFSERLSRRVTEWLVDHIARIDKSFGSFLRAVRKQP